MQGLNICTVSVYFCFLLVNLVFFMSVDVSLLQYSYNNHFTVFVINSFKLLEV